MSQQTFSTELFHQALCRSLEVKHQSPISSALLTRLMASTSDTRTASERTGSVTNNRKLLIFSTTVTLGRVEWTYSAECFPPDCRVLSKLRICQNENDPVVSAGGTFVLSSLKNSVEWGPTVRAPSGSSYSILIGFRSFPLLVPQLFPGCSAGKLCVMHGPLFFFWWLFTKHGGFDCDQTVVFWTHLSHQQSVVLVLSAWLLP